jgi:hypothetical protein
MGAVSKGHVGAKTNNIPGAVHRLPKENFSLRISKGNQQYRGNNKLGRCASNSQVRTFLEGTYAEDGIRRVTGGQFAPI